MSFRFRLQKLLELRDWHEKEQAVAVEEARTEAERALHALDVLCSLRAVTRERLEQAHGAGGRAGELGNLRFVLDRLDDQINAASARYSAAVEELDRTVDALTDAVRDRQTLERLRTRQAEAERTRAATQEGRALDEIAALRSLATRTNTGGPT